MELRSVLVGEGPQDFMHTISGGEEGGPPLVCLPGYGAGAAFYFRNFDGLAQQFRLHLVDLLGTGMSGESLGCLQHCQAAVRVGHRMKHHVTSNCPSGPS